MQINETRLQYGQRVTVPATTIFNASNAETGLPKATTDVYYRPAAELDVAAAEAKLAQSELRALRSHSKYCADGLYRPSIFMSPLNTCTKPL